MTFVTTEFRIISIMVTTSQKNTAILENALSPRQNKILQLMFSPVETNIEIRENPIL